MENILKKLSRGLGKLPTSAGRLVISGMLLAVLVLTAGACSSSGGQKVKATWVEPQISGSSVSIAVSDIENDTIVHFRVPDATGTKLTYMAYELDGTLYVRANVCPPCRSIGFSLAGNTLVCDSCGTVFDAKTGQGISGACVAYPKASAAFQNVSGNLVMNSLDLQVAYQNTTKPGLP